MSYNSTFYRVTPQIMLEYRTDQYSIVNTSGSQATIPSKYFIYRGLDDCLYYAENSRYGVGNTNFYSNQSLYMKYPDASRSKYTYYKDKNSSRVSTESMLEWLSENQLITDFNRVQKTVQTGPDGRPMVPTYYDKINIFLLRGFNFDKLDGISIRVKTTARKYVVDDDRSWEEPAELCLLDYYLRKDMLSASGSGAICVHTLDLPLYMNSKFYDRYITVEFPSPYAIALADDDMRRKYGKRTGNADYSVLYEETTDSYDNSSSIENYYLNPNDNVSIEFATVSENSESEEVNIDINGRTAGGVLGQTHFTLDPIDEGTVDLVSNTEFFNVRMYEDTESGAIIYYPVYGDTNTQLELDTHVMAQINSGAIPVTANGFADMTASNTELNGIDRADDSLYYVNSPVESNWKVYNDLDVGYQVGNTNEFYYEAYSRIIDYEQSGSGNVKFWRSKFMPDEKVIRDLSCNKIALKYTCRLVNEMRGVEVIRIATMVVTPSPVTNIRKYLKVNTYKLVNRIENPVQNIVSQAPVTKEKYIRSYYNATNLVAKNLGTGGNIYTQGQMTLRLNRTNNNYLVQLFRINDDNVRIPYDLTGPYKYKMVFPVGDGTGRLSISPNFDNKKQNLGIGTLVFYISGEQAMQIMQVPEAQRFFAIMTDVSGNAAQETTLYEGKVGWLS